MGRSLVRRGAVQQEYRSLGITYGEVSSLPEATRTSYRQGVITSRAKLIVLKVIFEGKTLGEMMEEYGISRNMVHKEIKRCLRLIKHLRKQAEETKDEEEDLA